MTTKINHLRVFFYLAIIAVCTFTISSCDDENNDIDPSKIIGSWTMDDFSGNVKIITMGITQEFDLAELAIMGFDFSGFTNMQFNYYSISSITFYEDNSFEAVCIDANGGEYYEQGEWIIENKKLYFDDEYVGTFTELTSSSAVLSFKETINNVEALMNADIEINAKMYLGKID